MLIIFIDVIIKMIDVNVIAVTTTFYFTYFFTVAVLEAAPFFHSLAGFVQISLLFVIAYTNSESFSLLQEERSAFDHVCIYKKSFFFVFIYLFRLVMSLLGDLFVAQLTW